MMKRFLTPEEQQKRVLWAREKTANTDKHAHMADHAARMLAWVNEKNDLLRCCASCNPFSVSKPDSLDDHCRIRSWRWLNSRQSVRLLWWTHTQIEEIPSACVHALIERGPFDGDPGDEWTRGEISLDIAEHIANKWEKRNDLHNYCGVFNDGYLEWETLLPVIEFEFEQLSNVWHMLRLGFA